MFSLTRFTRGLVLAGAVAGLTPPGPVLAQVPSNPPANLGAGGVEGVLLPPLTEPASPQPGADKDKAPESSWAKVPELQATPRPGWFLMPPTGSGYYTALDCLKGKCLDKAPASPYRTLFYDNDFRYLDKNDGQPVDCLDRLKRIHLGSLFHPDGDDWVLSIGGELRLQLKNEIDSRLTAVNNRYDLLRTRVYADLWYHDTFRVYVEYLDAQSYSQDLPPLAIDVDHSDLLNAFMDVKVAEIACHPAYVRLGRQELLYGSQRLISPLDWANTRRTFEGVKAFWHGDDLDVDAFWVRPVTVLPGRFDTADYSRQFAGLWTTYRPAKGQSVDAYYLYLDSDLPVAAVGRTTGGRFGYDVNTWGARYSGDHKMADFVQALGGGDSALCGDLLWDVEGAYQLGDYSNRLTSAGMATAGVGYHFAGLPMQPQLWAYYDYASGTPNPAGQGTFSTFNQLFPFGHYYLGILDQVGRENIHDLNFQASVYPAKWITALAQYHVFRLDQARDALFGVSPGFPINRRDLTGRAGTDVGEELDVIVNFQLDRHNSLQLGYAKLFGGDFIKQTGPNVSPELYYLQYSFRW
jgi:hypothetical protein